jgi:demethylmenaquinone methyltransferase/2-methoxy-6-polyprenyl-1,4-benzoquinol methylase
LIHIHLKFVIPFVGKLITDDSTAYRYLPASTLAFKTADELAVFEQVGYRRFMLDTIAVHWGQRPSG